MLSVNVFLSSQGHHRVTLVLEVGWGYIGGHQGYRGRCYFRFLVRWFIQWVVRLNFLFNCFRNYLVLGNNEINVSLFRLFILGF